MKMKREKHNTGHSISRRRFLTDSVKTGTVLASGLILRPGLPIMAGQTDDVKPVDLAVVQGYPKEAVARAVELLGGIDNFVRPNATVLLKPNVSFPNPSTWGTTTSPEVVRAMAELALEAGARRVIVADNTMRETDICFHKTGLVDALEGMENVKVIPIQKENYFTDVSVPNGKALKTVKIAKLIQRADAVINLPCAKSHSATQVSFGLKNLMGLIWDRAYFHQGTDLHSAIAELATVIRPELTLLDATRALVTAGPTGPGKVQELNTVLASTDPLAVDAYATSLAPWNNRSLMADAVKHLNHAAELGVGEMDLKKVNIRKVTV